MADVIRAATKLRVSDLEDCVRARTTEKTPKQRRGAKLTSPQIPEQEEVAHVSKDVHPSVHPGTAQPMAAHCEDAPDRVTDTARGVARQEQKHALRPAEAAADADVRRHASPHHHEIQRSAPRVAARVDPIDDRREQHLVA